jgi:FkbM family methyltransferase
MKNIIIYFISLFPSAILAKFENLFSISQGRGYSNPGNEANLILKFAKTKNLDLKIVFDIGSFHGDYTYEILKKFPNSSYYLFEPDENNYMILKKRFFDQKNLNLLNIAISNKNEESTFYSYGKGSMQGSLIDQDFSYLNLKNDIKQSVKVKRVDTLFEKFNLDAIDLCKIDVEGNEIKTLLGAGEKIRKIKIIQIEFSRASIDSKTFFKDFYKFFKDNNFKIYRITPSKLQKISNYDESLEYFRVSNFVAVNNEFID